MSVLSWNLCLDFWFKSIPSCLSCCLVRLVPLVNSLMVLHSVQSPIFSLFLCLLIFSGDVSWSAFMKTHNHGFVGTTLLQCCSLFWECQMEKRFVWLGKTMKKIFYIYCQCMFTVLCKSYNFFFLRSIMMFCGTSLSETNLNVKCQFKQPSIFQIQLHILLFFI